VCRQRRKGKASQEKVCGSTIKTERDQRQKSIFWGKKGRKNVGHHDKAKKKTFRGGEEHKLGEITDKR